VNPGAAAADKAEVQRLVVYAYPQNCSLHFVLRVADAAQARDFVAAIADKGWVTDASLDSAALEALQKQGICAANIGFTFLGLKALGLHLPYLRVFQEKAPAFAEGAFPRAARRLADTGPSAAQWWEKPFWPERAHVLLSLHGDTAAALRAFSAQLQQLPGAAGLDGWQDPPFDGGHLTADPKKRTVHFGFRDGIADPDIEGFHPKKMWSDGSRERQRHAPGEFLLGYRNDDNYNPWLLVNPSAQANPWLKPLNPAPQLAEFFRNGSFAAFRKMQQHERSYRAFEAEAAKQLGMSKEYLRAKLCGRWDNGRVARPDEAAAPSLPEPGDPAELDEFDFTDDLQGRGCPFGAHIRRMNPRADQDRVVPAGTRTLIRRGMPYGPAYDPNEKGDEPPRGLLGLFFCASLEDQFEHLLIEWGNANPMGPRNRGRSKDPLIGNHENPGAAFEVPMAGEKRRQIDGFKPFVTTRGTLYAFFPSLTALGRIARRGKPAP